jgi:L-amino acid N-acyltransferase YncA
MERFEIKDKKTGGVVIMEPMRREHLAAVRGIYNHYIRTTTHTFNVRELTDEEMAEIVFFKSDRWMTHIILDGTAVIGYVIVSPFKTREAYDISGEITVYLHPEHTGRGIGPEAVRIAEREAAGRGFHSLVAIICAENTPSVNMFKALGYEQCAHFREIGVKFGRMLDVVDYQRILP